MERVHDCPTEKARRKKDRFGLEDKFPSPCQNGNMIFGEFAFSEITLVAIERINAKSMITGKQQKIAEQIKIMALF